MSEGHTATPAKPKHRSPSYPAIDLQTALDRAQALWNHAQRHYVPTADAMAVWGYSPKSSGGLQTIGALKRFGLIEDQGKANRRQIRVSDLGRSIVTDEPSSPYRRTRIQEAALMPPIHREIWDEWDGQLPPDSAIRYYLVNDRAFGDGAARELIDQLRRTLAFAGLAEGYDTLSPDYREPDETGPTVTSATAVPPARVSPGLQPAGVQLPLGPGEWATLHGAFPISESQWRQMLAVLEAMKPGLVASDEARRLGEEPDEA
jgi:hypothetical protein